MLAIEHNGPWRGGVCIWPRQAALCDLCSASPALAGHLGVGLRTHMFADAGCRGERRVGVLLPDICDGEAEQPVCQQHDMERLRVHVRQRDSEARRGPFIVWPLSSISSVCGRLVVYG